MKKYIVLCITLGLLIGCSKDSVKNNNPYLPTYTFSIMIDTNLPLYAGLKSPVNPILIHDSSGNNLIVMKISDTDFRAWNDSCPNQYPTACSNMTIHGVNAKCACDNIEYSIFTGVGAGQYSMVPYRVEVLSSNLIRIYN